MGRSFDFVAFTRVSATRPLYERDIMNTLCLPEGARMSLTYRRTWTDDKTWQRCCTLAAIGRAGRVRSASALRLRMLLVLNEPEAQPNQRYLPLRFATLEAVEIHEHLSSSFASEDKVEPGVTLFIGLCERPSERLMGELADVLAYCRVVQHDQPLVYYLHHIADPAASLSPYQELLAPVLNWQRHLAMIIRRSKSLQGERHWAVFGPFKRARGLRAGAIAAPVRRAALHATTLSLQGGTSYEIDCHVHESSVGTFSEPPVSVTVVGAHVEVSPAGVSQFGGGALVNFLVSTQRKFAPELVGIDFAVLAKGSDGKMARAPRGKAPEFHCRLELGPPAGYWILTFVLLLASAILLNISADTIADLVLLWSGERIEPPPPIYTNLSLWSKGIGGALVALTSIYALRKMPVGK
jgi:hypothetical protein